ncbi:MAG: hypothetical protein WBW33_21440 [Bryobacteraceae bacterium]
MVKGNWRESMMVLAGLLVSSTPAMPQTNTISAKAGGIDVIEGAVFLDGQPYFQSTRPMRFLGTDDVLSTGLGTAEIVLAPDVFLRIQDNTEIRVVSLSLTNAELELKIGKAMVMVGELVKDTRLRIIDHGASVLVKKPGIYQFAANNPPVVDVITGKVEASYRDTTVMAGAGHKVVILDRLERQKSDRKGQDALWAWSAGHFDRDGHPPRLSGYYRVERFGGWFGLGSVLEDTFARGTCLPGYGLDTPQSLQPSCASEPPN